MAACPPQVFDAVSAAAWSCLQRAVAAKLGITVSGDRGQAGKLGVTIGWDYDAAAQRLTLTCLDKPFIVSCDYVNGQIAEAVNGSGCL
jgi:hypothetical protein